MSNYFNINSLNKCIGCLVKLSDKTTFDRSFLLSYNLHCYYFVTKLLDRCSTSGGKPEDVCMKLVYHMLSLMSSLAEAVKDLLQPMPELFA